MPATHGVYLLVVHILVIVAELRSDWTLALQQHTYCDAHLPRPSDYQYPRASETFCSDKADKSCTTPVTCLSICTVWIRSVANDHLIYLALVQGKLMPLK